MGHELTFGSCDGTEAALVADPGFLHKDRRHERSATLFQRFLSPSNWINGFMSNDFLDRIHPERSVAGFTKLDGTVTFYSFVKAIMRDMGARRVMDFGAGRGAFSETRSRWRRELQDLRQYGAEVWACDPDPVVMNHPCSDHRVVTEPGKPLPIDDGFFDLIVSDVTFEHIADPAVTARELLRVLRPGGVICARTPNRFGYAKLLTQIVPNSLHVKFLRVIQPGRKAEDIFPTVYKLNDVGSVRRYFSGCNVHWYRDSAEPAYYFGNSLLYRLGLLIHKLLPDVLSTSICFFIVKPHDAGAAGRGEAAAS